MHRFAAWKTSLAGKLEPTFQPIGDAISLREFASDVRQGLTKKGQKELYSKYLYDDVGSALFDAITVLPEYGLTRADANLLRRRSADLAKLAGNPTLVAELGSGSGGKTAWILAELASTQPVTYCPIDISEAALRNCWRELSQIEKVEIVPFAQSYLEGLEQAVRLRPPGTPLLVLFLGSTIGNFEPPAAEEFLSTVRRSLLPGDVLYLSTDLVKDTGVMLAAYDDAVGVTAAFNLNLLARINRELQGDFVLSRFAHEVRFNERESRIEMHLRSKIDQTVNIGKDLTIGFRAGETIWTESSYKFRPADVVRLAVRSGFECQVQWADEEWPFAQSVLRAR